MNVAKQSGLADCGLHATAIITCLVLDIDPTTVVFKQEELRPHFARSLESGTITAFPVDKHRRPANRVSREELCLIYCYCRLPDNGKTMFCCNGCAEWFHDECIDVSAAERTMDTWFCNNCTPKQ